MRTFVSLLTVVCALCVTGLTQTADEMKLAGELERAAGKSYQSKNFIEFLSQIEKANANRPNHPRLIYNLAIAYAINGRTDDALNSLERLAKMGLGYAFEKDDDLKPLFENERFKTILAIAAANRSAINASTKAFSIADNTLIAESVAYEHKTKSYFVGSVHLRKIVKVDANGAANDYSKPEDGLWSVLGIRSDTARGYLWAASSAMPHMKGFTAEDKGRAGIFKYDLRTGKLIKKYLLPAGENHVLGDVLFDGQGNVYATDSVLPNIYRVDLKKDAMSLFLTSDLFASLQGLAFGGRNELFVADYSKGIFRIDLQTKAITQLKPAENITLLGIDGLYYYRGQLIAIQNGVNPNRVISLTINGDRIDSFKTLEANHPDFMEPTLGTLVGDDFYYVANSQWPLVNEKAELNMEKLRSPVILKMDARKALAK